MSDIDIDPTQIARERLAQSRSQQQIRAVRDAQAADAAARATQYRGYDAAQGKPIVQAVGGGVERGDRIITNGLIQPGDTVRMRGRSVDQMPRIITPTKKEVIIPKLTYSSAAFLVSKGYTSGYSIPCRCSTTWIPDPNTEKCLPTCDGTGCATLAECIGGGGWYPNQPPENPLEGCNVWYAAYGQCTFRRFGSGWVVEGIESGASGAGEPKKNRPDISFDLVDDFYGFTYLIEGRTWTNTSSSFFYRNTKNADDKYLGYYISRFQTPITSPNSIPPLPSELAGELTTWRAVIVCGVNRNDDPIDNPQRTYTPGEGTRESIEIFLAGDRKKPLSLLKLNASERFQAWIAAPTKTQRLIDIQYGKPNLNNYCGFQSFKVDKDRVSSVRYSAPSANTITKGSWLKHWSQNLPVNFNPDSGLGCFDAAFGGNTNVYAKQEDYFEVTLESAPDENGIVLFLSSEEWLALAQKQSVKVRPILAKWGGESLERYSDPILPGDIKIYKFNIPIRTSTITVGAEQFPQADFLKFLGCSAFATTNFQDWEYTDLS